MDESIMGKSCCLYKTIILFACLCTLPLFNPVSVFAVQEDELFEKAYEYYLSYDAEKALEYFDIFLKDFPGSSAKDAALFWKVKSLTHLKRTDEALKIFRDIKQSFPESPFIPFVEKELSLYEGGSRAVNVDAQHSTR